MAILESCQINHWDLDSYTNSEHPYHKKLMGLLSQLLEENIDGIPLVVDGCLLPSPVFTVAQMAKLYQRLAAAGPIKPAGTATAVKPARAGKLTEVPITRHTPASVRELVFSKQAIDRTIFVFPV